jgi:hypothetical protein
VFADVDQYTSWAGDARCPGLGLDGIFFDETPNNFTEEAKEYLEAITKKVKGMGSMLGEKLV